MRMTLRLLVFALCLASVQVAVSQNIITHVFEDVNGNGVDDTEPAIPGLLVTLFNDTDFSTTPDPSEELGVMADIGGGDYEYIGAPVGADLIIVYTLAGSGLTNPLATRQSMGPLDNDLDSDVRPAGPGPLTLRTDVFQIFNTPSETFVDAGLIAAVSISDNTWLDDNGNGIRDGGETNLDGVTVELLDATGTPVVDALGNAVNPQVTAGGAYAFDNLLPGDYQVTFDVTTVPGAEPHYLTAASGFLTDTDNSDAIRDAGNQTGATPLITTVSGDVLTYVDAGAYQAVSIGDFVFEDADGDGLSTGPDDVPLDGIEVALVTPANVLVGTDAAGNPLPNPVNSGSAGAGLYEFIDVAPGDYRVRFTATAASPNGNNYYTTIEDVQGAGPLGDDDSDAIRLASAQQGEVNLGVVTSGSTDEETRVDAGFYAPVTIGDFVWHDLNADGLQDEGNIVPPDNFTIELQAFGGGPVNDANGAPFAAQNGGAYQFLLVPPGNYQVVFTAPVAGAFPYIFSMLDANGAGEDDTNDSTDDSDADEATGISHEIIVLSDEIDEETRIDAGAIACVRIGGDFWADANGDGLFTGGELPVDGVVLRLFDDVTGAQALDCDGVAVPDQTTGTGPAGAGSYQFENVPPGDYYVEIQTFPTPPNYVLTQFDLGGAGPLGDTDSDFDGTNNDQTLVFTVESGDTDEETRVDGGLVSPVIIGDQVWHDINGDGVQNGGEPGLPNIEVTIVRQDGNPVNDILGNPIATTVTTDATGNYQFSNIPSADYTIIFESVNTEPDFYLTLEDYSGATGATDATDDSDAIPDAGGQSGRVDITPVVDAANPDGTEVIRIDAGFFDPVSLGDMVWHDRNLDGTQDEAPLDGIPGVQVRLLDGTGAPVAQDAAGAPLVNPTFTDGGGMYTFDLIPPGLGYTIEFSDGTDWYLTPLSDASGAGPAGTDDSDAVFVAGTWQAGTTLAFDLVSENTTGFEDNSLRIDAGFYDPSTVGDMVWHDLNANGLQDDAPLGGPTDEFMVEIAAIGPSALGGPTPTDDAEGNALPLTTTTAGGMYEFDLLKPGEYQVTFVKPGAAVPEYVFTLQDASGGTDEASDLGDDSDADFNTGITHDINIESREDVDLPGLDEIRIDAGVFRCVMVGGDAWVDANGNGLQDAGEGPLDGVVFQLLDNATGNPVTIDCNGGPLTNPVTSGTGPNGAGSYQFENVRPGEYVVELVSLPAADQTLTVADASGPGTPGDDDSDFPMGAAPQVTAAFTVDSESMLEEERIDAGIIQPAALEITVWHDSNGDGEQQIGSGDECGEDLLDADEAMFQLLDAGAPANDAMGNPVVFMNMGGGIYRADNLAPGLNYTVAATPGGGWNITLPHFDGTTADVGDSDADSDFDQGSGQSPVFEIEAGNNKVNIDLGMWQFMTLGGFVFFSNDCSTCTFGAPPDQDFASEVIINLFGEDPVGSGNFTLNLGQVQTGMMGEYEFTMLPPGDYRIELDKGTFEVGGQFEVFMPLPLCDDPNNDQRNENDSEGAFNGDGGVDINFARMRSGCEPDGGGTENRTFDIGICFEFDCSATNQQYLEDQCTTVDPTNPDHNTFFPICDVFILDQFCATMITGNSPGSQPSPLCANGGVPHNISWFSFVAGTGDYQLEVVPGNCNNAGGAIGIQNGIYTDCTFSEEVQCQGQCSTAPIVMNSQDPPGSGNYQLEPCEVYFWFLDGCNGSVCDFEINVLGTFNQCDPDDPTNLICTGTSSLDSDCLGSLCPGETVVLELEGFELEGVTYNWSVTPDDGQWTINNSDPDFSIPTLTLEPRLDITFDPILDPGDSITYTVCWENLRSKCVNKDGHICKDIKVKRLDNEDFGTVSICEFDLFAYAGPEFDENGDPDPNGDGALGWQCPTAFVPGVNECDVVTPEGCEYTQTIFVVELLNSEPERFDTVVCDEWEFLGVDFPAENWVERPFFLSPDILNANGCDTFIDLYAWYMNIGGLLTGDCITGANGQPAFALTLDTFDISDASPNNTTLITVDWYWEGLGFGEGFEQFDGDPDGNPFTFITDEAGVWQVVVTMTVPDEDTGEPLPGCEFVFEIDVDPSIFFPADPVPGPWNLMPCAAGNPPVLYTITSGPDETPTWIWPSDVTSATGQGTDSLTIDWNGSAGGEIGVFVTNECGVSDTITAIVTLIDVPDPVIAINLDTTCVDSIFTITSVGPTIGGEVYTWGFSGGVVQGGPATGPGPHQVSWPSVGDFEVTLQVSVGACVSTIATDTVTTVPPIAVPVIICGGSTNSSASFTWAPVPGAIEYIVEVIMGPTPGVVGTQTNTDYTVTGMNVNDGAIIQVTAVTENPCGNTVGISVECFAQDCPNEMITLTSANDTLCFDPTLGLSTIDIAWADGTVPPGTGVFTGDGIDDGTVAAFNPISAGIGAHTVIYTFTGDGLDGGGVDYTGCVYSAAMTFLIRETPTSDFTITNDDICITDQSLLTYTGTTPNANFTWTFVPDAALSSPVTDGSGPHNITWPTAGSKSVELVVDRNGCVSTPTTQTAEVDDLVEQVDVECGNSTATTIEFIWNDVANSSDFALIEDGTPIANQTTTSLTRTGLAPGTEITLIVEAISDNLCPGTVDTVTCIAQNCPEITLTLNPFPDTVVCSDVAAFDLMWSLTGGLQDGSGVGTWSGTGITDTAAGTFDPSVSGLGDFEITFNYVEGPGGTCTESATVDVSVISLPVVDFTISQDTICLNDVILVNYTGMPTSLRPQMTVSGGTLDASGNGRDFRWSFDTEGTYTILAEAFAGSCIGTPMMDTVVVLPTPDETVVVRCDSSNLDYIRFAWEALTCASTFEVFIDGVSVGIQSDLTYEITSLNEGDTRTITVEPINECDCATVNADTETCEATACPEISATITPDQTEICTADIVAGLTIGITANVMSDGTGTGTSEWMGTNVDQTGQFSPEGLAPGTYDIMYSYTEQGGACGAQAMTSITINTTPQGLISAVNPECIEDNFGSATLGSAVEGEVYEYVVNGTPTTDPELTGLAPGNYQVEFVDPISGCSSMENFEIVSAPNVTAEIQVDGTIILVGETATLRVEVMPIDLSDVDDITWTNTTTGEVIPCELMPCPQIMVSPEETTQYCATVTYNDGCIVDACAEVRVVEDRDLDFPNIFRPEDATDAANSKFYIRPNGEWTEVLKLRIFNRWGELVYSANNIPSDQTFERGWDGTFKGQVVNPGVFVWTAEIVTIDDNGNPEVIIEKGDVTVIR